MRTFALILLCFFFNGDLCRKSWKARRDSARLETRWKQRGDNEWSVCVCMCVYLLISFFFIYVAAHKHSYASLSRLNTKMSLRRSPLQRHANENKWRRCAGGWRIPGRNLHSSVICTASFFFLFFFAPPHWIKKKIEEARFCVFTDEAAPISPQTNFSP